MGRISFLLGTAVRDLRRTGALGGAAVLLTGLAVLVAGGTLLGLEALARLTGNWRADLRVVAVLGAEPARPGEMLVGVRALPGVGAVRYVSSDTALTELRQYLGAAGAGLDRLPANPVPARLEVTPDGGLSAAGIDSLVAALQRLPGVEEVQAAAGWVEPSERAARGLRAVGSSLAVILGVAAVWAVAGASRLARLGRADETSVLRLSGVSEACVWVPLLLQSVALGGAGAALGWSVLVLLSEAAGPWTGGWVWGTLALAPLPAPSWVLGAMLLAGGVTAGIAGGLAAGRP